MPTNDDIALLKSCENGLEFWDCEPVPGEFNYLFDEKLIVKKPELKRLSPDDVLDYEQKCGKFLTRSDDSYYHAYKYYLSITQKGKEVLEQEEKRIQQIAIQEKILESNIGVEKNTKDIKENSEKIEKLKRDGARVDKRNFWINFAIGLAGILVAIAAIISARFF